ncbi:MAG: S-adenosylmethionine-dependent methyltransferase [Candelina mexicana]|nr:MAG: S-adenosylmethionine-dependent methyltransferase [Candelina mexicana]
MLPTPSTSHVSFDNIYEPAEDSYLLLDTLSSTAEKSFLKSRFGLPEVSAEGKSIPFNRVPAPLIADIGTGSGVILAFLTANARAIFGIENVLTIGTDLNSFACEATAKTVELAARGASDEQKTLSAFDDGNAGNCGFFTDALLADLSTPIRDGMIDLLVFNPPYVPTPELSELPQTELVSTSSADRGVVNFFKRDSHFLFLSYAGGFDGMETTNRVLTQLPNVLHKHRGVAYILLCAQNKPEEVKARVRGWGSDWAVETVSSSGKSGGWEKLHVIRIWRV